MVVRSCGFPALEMPCSCATDPLPQGVGANPAYAATCRRLEKLRNTPRPQDTCEFRANPLSNSLTLHLAPPLSN